jgi:hypothetical protein
MLKLLTLFLARHRDAPISGLAYPDARRGHKKAENRRARPEEHLQQVAEAGMGVSTSIICQTGLVATRAC